MKVVFMGTPAFAVPALRALADSRYDLVAVYTRPDAASGRGHDLHPCETKAAAVEEGLTVYTPEDLHDDAELQRLRELDPDVIVVAAYGAILPPEVLAVPRYGCLNIHASALPRWRGAAPIQRAILEGDESAGVCIMQMEEGLDTGNYHLVATVDIGSKSSDELSEELAELGASGLLEALDGMEDGSYGWERQDEEEATYAPKISKEEVLLSPELSVHTFLRRVQAANRRAPARCMVCGKPVSVIAARLAPDRIDAGIVFIDTSRLILGMEYGRTAEILRVKPDGKQEMKAQDWTRGLRDVPLEWSEVG
ncbi:MAG: methionyl-tRNA formyltransferase [Coriobacteriaceae bacterium]|nr:methionyl-tRNA formyltransferase [Coriobacteriaceae bacterium]